MLKVLFNTDGSIAELSVMESINQGSNNVNKVFASILDRPTVDYTCIGEFELPSGDLEELSGVADTQSIGLNSYNGYTISLAESVTREAGNLKLNLKLIDLQGNVLCTYQVTLKVNKTGYEPSETRINESQYNSLLQSLNSAFVNGVNLLFFESYSNLPATGKPNTIYCVPNADYETNHLYDQYTWNPTTNAYRFFGRFLNSLDYVYPVGAIYISTVSTSPASIFGGSWEQLENRFLLGAGTSYTAGDTGGEAEHTLTVDEMPNHYHTDLYQYSTGPFKWGNGSTSDFSVEYNTENKGGSPITTGTTGGGQAHNNMPPYLVVYMWKRIA